MPEETRVQKIKREWEEAKKQRLPFEAPLWTPVINFLVPHRMAVNVDTIKPQTIGTYIFDGTPQSALQVATDGFYSNLVSPKFKWRKSTLPISVQGRQAYRNGIGGNVIPLGRKDITKDGRLDHIKEVKVWLEDMDDVMDAAYRKSNFYDEARQLFEDKLTFDTPVMWIEEDEKNNRIVFSVRHPGEVWIDRNMFGETDKVYRKLKIRLDRAVERWGKDRLPQQMKQALNTPNSGSQMYDFLHVVQKRLNPDYTRPDNKGKPIEDLYIYLDGKDDEAIVEEGGHDSFPYVVGKPSKKIPNNPYGFSLCMEAIVPTTVINQVGRDLLHLGNRVARPVTMIAEDLKNSYDDRPGAKNYFQRPYDNKEQLVYELATVGNYPVTEELLARLGKNLEEMLMVPMFQAISRAERPEDMKATVARYMTGERAALAAPRIWGCERMLDNASDAVFEIEFRAGRIPPMPDILYEFLGERIDFEFIGPLSLIQKQLIVTQNIQTALEIGLPFIQLNPALVHKIDLEGAFEEILSTNGWPARYIYSKDEFAAVMQALQQQQAQQMQLQAMDVGSKAMQRGQKAPEPGSPTARVMGGE